MIAQFLCDIFAVSYIIRGFVTTVCCFSHRCDVDVVSSIHVVTEGRHVTANNVGINFRY